MELSRSSGPHVTRCAPMAKMITSLLLLAIGLDTCSAFTVGTTGRRVAAAQATLPPHLQKFTMKSQEDKEFEEWVRKKKIAAGVDPDEDFATGRQNEGRIYVVGGAWCALCLLELWLTVRRWCGRSDHRPGAALRRHMGVQRGLPHAAVSSGWYLKMEWFAVGSCPCGRTRLSCSVCVRPVVDGRAKLPLTVRLQGCSTSLPELPKSPSRAAREVADGLRATDISSATFHARLSAEPCPRAVHAQSVLAGARCACASTIAASFTASPRRPAHDGGNQG